MGQLGRGGDGSIPGQIRSDSDWLTIACGYYHTLGLKTSGILWAWGGNYYGQLGFGNSGSGTQRPTPTQIGTDSDWSGIVTGWNHTIARKTNSTIWAWGVNDFGQLGLGDTLNRNTPTQIRLGIPERPLNLTAQFIPPFQINLSWIDPSNEQGFKIERSVSTNTAYTLLATVNADVTSYSDITTTGFSPNVRYYYRVKSYNIFGDSAYSNEAVAVFGDWAMAAGGANHTISLKNNGTLWSCGDNTYGQLGLGGTISRNTLTQIGTDSDWSMIDSRYESTVALKTNSTLWRWGSGSGTTPSQVGTASNWSTVTASYGLKTNRTLWTVSSNPIQVGTQSDWSKIATGYGYTIALKTGDTCWAWGVNSSGQLGLGDTTSKPTPTQVGSDSDWSAITAGYTHTLACKRNPDGSVGTLWAWGSNNWGELGVGGTWDEVYQMWRPESSKNTPTQVGIDSDWSAVSAGGSGGGLYDNLNYTLAVKTDRTLWGWGKNSWGLLSDGIPWPYFLSVTPFQLGTNSDWSAISAGGGHAIALKSLGTMWVWGRNLEGQLGLGDTINRNVPTQVGE